MKEFLKKNVLMIDDDEISLIIGQKIIDQSEGSSTFRGFNYAQQALHFLRLKPKIWPDIIFVDINMPLMNGWEFVDKLNNDSDYTETNTTICMLTSSSNPDDLAQFNKRKAVDLFFTKPFTDQYLQKAMDFSFQTFK